MLATASLIVDGYALSLGFSAPSMIGQPQSYAVLNHLALLYASARIESKPRNSVRAGELESDFERLRDEISKRKIDLADAKVNDEGWQAQQIKRYLGSDAYASVPSGIRREAVIRLGAQPQGEGAFRQSGCESLLREWKPRHMAIIDPDDAYQIA